MFLDFHDIAYGVGETYNCIVKTFIRLIRIQNGIGVQITEKKAENFLENNYKNNYYNFFSYKNYHECFSVSLKKIIFC